MTLLERDAELSRLRALLTDAGRGHGRVAIIGGEPGIGKTTLVSTFTADIADRVRIGVGRCDALVTPRTLGPLLDVLSSLGISTSNERDTVLDSLIADVRRNGQTVVVIEDVHWADDSSIDLIVMLARRVLDLPLLLILTYRDSEIAVGHPLQLAIGDLVTSSSTAWLGLSPLTKAAVNVLADQCGVSGDLLYERTGGNPFFVTEVLATPAFDVPGSVRLAVAARAARLDPSARSVLDAVSVVPGRAEEWLVAAIGEQPQAALHACVDAGVLTADRGTYAFRHELARLVIEADLADGARRALNQRALDALATRGDVDPARPAHHAEVAGDDEALAAWALRAFRSAIAQTAYREAAQHGERALSLQQFLSADEVADLQMNLATAMVSLARGDEADTLARRAVGHWQAAGDGRREAAALLVSSSVMLNLGRTDEAMEILGRAVAILEHQEPGPELALAYVRLASSHMLARDRDAAVQWGERAIALATKLDDPALLGRALIETGTADVMDSRFEGLRRIRDGIDLGRQRNLPAVVSHGLSQIGSGYGEMRRYEQAVPALVEGSTFAASHNLEASRRYQVAWLARCRFDLGEWGEAEALAREAITGTRTVAIAMFVGLNTLGWLRARRGEVDAFPLLDEALEIARETAHLQRLWPCAIARAEAGWLDGDLDSHIPLLLEVFELALHRRHGIAVGEIGVWLQRGGALSAPPADAAEPFASWIAGDHMGATAGFRQMGCPYETASVLADTGELRSLREAHATFQRLGAAPMVRRVSEALRSQGVRVSASLTTSTAAPRHPSGLSGREIEVLKLVAAGFTNPQLASSLYISRKTAEHHVSSILMKLGVATRSEAAAAAVRLVLVG